MTERKDRARILILSHIAQFSLQCRIGNHVYGGLNDMSFRGDTKDVIPGDLVAVQSASPSKWYLGWLVSKQWPEGWACEQYTIESIEDGELCNWHNVGLIYYDRSQIRAHPEWRWTDKQHVFNDRWKRLCFKDRDAYMHLPVDATFEADGVELAVRVRFGLDDTVIRRSFDKWTRITNAELLEFYDAASAELSKPKVA